MTYQNFLNKKGLILFCAGAFVVILCAGSYFFGLHVQQSRYVSFLKSFKNIRENSEKYSFINPLIGGASAPATDVGIFTDIQNDIFDYLLEEEKDGNLYNYSFYYRDFNTGLWFGINESAKFSPASLFKLPIALAAYKQGEVDQSFLSRNLLYTEDIAAKNMEVSTNSESVLVVGGTYNVTDLVNLMLETSDNGAKNLLLSNMDLTYLNKLFEIVSLLDPNVSKTFEVSSREYALFLRVLYGSSYLNEEHSELILKMLAKSNFKDGLVAEIPKNVEVAHKFGVYDFEEVINGVVVHGKQLHDCGIVYHKTDPYLFCLMTKGKDSKNLYRVISHVSKMVYDYQENDGQ